MNVAVLLGTIGFESYAFVTANAELRSQIETDGWSGLREAFAWTSDVTALTAFTEDAIALGGATIALGGVVLSRVTGNAIYDAVTAGVIGLLLMGFALALAWENKRLLLGENVPPDVESRLRAVVTEQAGVTGVEGFRSIYVGPGRLLVTVDASLDPTLETEAVERTVDGIETALRAADDRVAIVYVEPET